MAKYTYKCECGEQTVIEIKMGFPVPEATPCDHCDHVARRVFIVPGINFVGSGWTKEKKKAPRPRDTITP